MIRALAVCSWVLALLAISSAGTVWIIVELATR